MICDRCHTDLCFGPDTKSCSDQIIIQMKARIAELEDYGHVEGFFGRACARLLLRNRELYSDARKYEKFWKDMIHELCGFERKMEDWYGMEFADDYGGIDAVTAVCVAMNTLLYLGNNLRHAISPQERYDAENAWDNHLMRFKREGSPNKGRT